MPFFSLRLYLAKLLVPEDRSLRALSSLNKRVHEAEKHAEYHEAEAVYYRKKLESVHESTCPYQVGSDFHQSHPS